MESWKFTQLSVCLRHSYQTPPTRLHMVASTAWFSAPLPILIKFHTSGPWLCGGRWALIRNPCWRQRQGPLELWSAPPSCIPSTLVRPSTRLKLVAIISRSTGSYIDLFVDFCHFCLSDFVSFWFALVGLFLEFQSLIILLNLVFPSEKIGCSCIWKDSLAYANVHVDYHIICGI